MPLKKSSGNMYPWVTHQHCHLGGECVHRCVYCYIDNPRWGRPAKYTGRLRLIEEEFDVKYGEGKTIFIENCSDLFAAAVPGEFIRLILNHCLDWPKNTYVFQTKNPARYAELFNLIPAGSLLGTTIESNRHYPEIMRDAPKPTDRYEAMARLPTPLDGWNYKTFVTVEPILDFDCDFPSWLINLRPDFVNIGADSKRHGLPEPSGAKIRELLQDLDECGIEVRQKQNLKRLLS